MFCSSEREAQVLRTLGRELRRSRMALGERQADFARRIGISIPTYRRMERGCGRVPLAYWLRVLSVLDFLGGLETILQSGNRSAPLNSTPVRVRRKNLADRVDWVSEA